MSYRGPDSQKLVMVRICARLGGEVRQPQVKPTEENGIQTAGAAKK